MPHLDFCSHNLPGKAKDEERDRRFSIEDKSLALSLLKQSPKAYRLLQKMLALPPRKTIIAVLKVPLKYGITKPIFRCMQETVKKLSPRD
jgi:hypothetical protein